MLSRCLRHWQSPQQRCAEDNGCFDIVNHHSNGVQRTMGALISYRAPLTSYPRPWVLLVEPLWALSRGLSIEAELRSHSAWRTDDETPPTTNGPSQSGIQQISRTALSTTHATPTIRKSPRYVHDGIHQFPQQTMRIPAAPISPYVISK